MDGTPVIDLKPYLPFCESISDGESRAPHWVARVVEGGPEPLAVGTVTWAAGAREQVDTCWSQNKNSKRGSLYDSKELFAALVEECLGRDIRPAHHRSITHSDNTKDGNDNATNNNWTVLLEGVEVSFKVDEENKNVTILSARLLPR